MPLSGSSSVEMTRISVDLPEPLAPRTPKISPRSTRSETSSTARTRFGADVDRHGTDHRSCDSKLSRHVETPAQAERRSVSWLSRRSRAELTFTEKHLIEGTKRRIGQSDAAVATHVNGDAGGR